MGPTKVYRWCHTLAEMLGVLHTVSSQMLAKLKQNQPFEICLHFHGLQKIISFTFLFCYLFCIHVLPLLYKYSIFFLSFIISGRGRGRGGGGNNRGRGHGHVASGMMKPMPSKPCKGRKLNKWDTDDMKATLAEFDREMQVLTSSASLIFFCFSGLISKCVSNSFLLGFFDLSPFSISKRLQNLTFLMTSSSSSSK